MLRRLRARRDERGAVAVIFALLAVMLMSLAALGTDIGNEVNRKTVTQTQADFGAFRAADQMTATGRVGATVPPAVATAVAASMNANAPQDDNGISTITAAQLTDGNFNNGEIQYTSQGLQVTAPRHWVSFGLARVMGFQGKYVQAQATVNIFSPGLRVLPMFAVLGCDYGLQTLADPANGHDLPTTPTLAFNTETNDTQIQNPPGLVLTDSTGTTVNSIALNSTGNKLTVTAKNWDNSEWIGFFRADDTTPSLIQKVAVPGSPYSQNPATAVTVNIPDAVAAVQTAWYVRIYDSTGNEDPTAVGHSPGTWSPVSESLGIRVGAAVLQCAQGSSDGNFGTLKLPRSGTPSSNDLPLNIASGLQPPLSLTKHQQWATDSPAGKCTDTVNNAVTSPGSLGTLNSGTNCVSTDTGLAANDATQGLITGIAGTPGLLTTASTKPGCAPDGGNANRTVTVTGTGGGTFNLDNSVLTCYFTNTTTSIADIAQPDSSFPASAAHTLDKSIVDDPRFVWVPVVAVRPDCGTCANYSIIDFRPGFITDQQPISQSTKNSTAAQNGVTSDNGVGIANNGITSLKVVFFNIQAMPLDTNGKVIDYLGVGQKIIRLVN